MVPYTEISKLYIDGEWAAPSSGETAPVLNPATEAVLGLAPVGGDVEAQAAIAAAREAFDNGPWPLKSFNERAEVMTRFHAALEGRLGEIQALTIAETGCPWGLAHTLQTVVPMDHMAYAIDRARRIEPTNSAPETGPSFMPGAPDYLGAVSTVREPVGVVAGITAYNFPFMLNLSKVAPALLAGNTMVLKPSPFTPFAALMLGQVADEVGLPAGVLNIITGGIEVSKTLTTHPDVDMVSFTGSDVVGSLIMAQAAPSLKRVMLENGGKSALIVRADADLQLAAMTAVQHMTGHAGQGCALLTRYIVHNSVRSEFVAMAKGFLSQMPMGNPSNPDNLVGPLIRASQRENVERYVQHGLDSGARLVIGGQRPDHLSKGFFYMPTLFDDVDNNAKIAQDEIFGPVGVVIGFDTDEEAIRMANTSRFGLAGAIMSADRARAYRMALKLRTGTVMLNGGYGGMMSVNAPFGGYKRSGFGREYGPNWLNEYLSEKAISFPIG
ncbi:MAG: aldehyde dehydrogenase [Sphingomonadales bacterium]|nr:aldehyde dehydrogenase [Sphingomonadales bacterium]